MSDHAELRKMIDAATPVPWEASVMGSEGYAIMGGPRPGQHFRDRVARLGDVDWDTDKANAELAAAAVTALPDLLDELDLFRGLAMRHIEGWVPQFSLDPAKCVWVSTTWDLTPPEQMTPAEVEWYRQRRAERQARKTER